MLLMSETHPPVSFDLVNRVSPTWIEFPGLHCLDWPSSSVCKDWRASFILPYEVSTHKAGQFIVPTWRLQSSGCIISITENLECTCSTQTVPTKISWYHNGTIHYLPVSYKVTTTPMYYFSYTYDLPLWYGGYISYDTWSTGSGGFVWFRKDIQ